MRNRYLHVLVCVLISAVMGVAAPVEAADGLQVRVHEIGSKPVEARVKAFGPELALASDRTIPWGRILALDLLPAPDVKKSTKAHWRAWLVGGEVLHATIAGTAQDGDALRLAVADIGTVEVNLDTLSVLEFVPANAGNCHDLLESHEADPDNDVAYDDKEDALRGTLVAVGEKGVTLEDRREKERQMTWAQLRVLRLANEPAPAPQGAVAEVELGNGTRLRTANAPALRGGSLLLRTLSLPDVDLKVAASRVKTIRWNGGAFVWASGLPFTSKVMLDDTVDHDDIGATKILAGDFWNVRVDRRATNGRGEESREVCPLRVGGVAYRHGFAVQAHTEITIQLDKAYSSFQCWFGIDDNVLDGRPDATGKERPMGDVDAHVVCDGEERWKADSVKGGNQAVSVGPIDVTGVTELVLIVGRGPDKLNVYDRADWLEPILVRAK